MCREAYQDMPRRGELRMIDEHGKLLQYKSYKNMIDGPCIYACGQN